MNKECKLYSLRLLKNLYNTEKCRLLGLLFKTQEAVNFYEVVISPKMKYYISIKGGRCKTRRIIKYMIKDLDRQISRIDKMLNL